MADKFAGGIKAGSTDVTIPVELRLSADSTEKTGVAHTDVTARYWHPGSSPATITMASLSAITDAHSDGGWRQVDATNQPGLYRFDIPDAAFASGVDWVIVTVKVADCFVEEFYFPLESQNAAGLSTLVAAIKAKTDNLPADPADASDIAAAIATLAGYIDTEVAAILAAVDTEVAAIKAKTDNLPSDPADASDIAAAIATLAGYIDTEVAAILAAVDTEIAAIKAKTDLLSIDIATAATRLLTGLQADGSGGWQATTLFLANGGGGAPTAVQIRQEIDSNSTQLALIVAQTASLSGSGAYPITVTVVDDNDDPVQNAKVRVIDGVTNPMLVTNADGEATFALDAGTFSVVVRCAGYDGLVTTRTVTGIQAGTLTANLQIALIVAPAPSEPDACTVTGTVRYPDRTLAAGETLSFELTTRSGGAVAGGNFLIRKPINVRVNAAGQLRTEEDAPFELTRTDAEDMPDDAYYKLTCSFTGTKAVRVTLTAPAFDISDIFAV